MYVRSEKNIKNNCFLVLHSLEGEIGLKCRIGLLFCTGFCKYSMYGVITQKERERGGEFRAELYKISRQKSLYSRKCYAKVLQEIGREKENII